MRFRSVPGGSLVTVRSAKTTTRSSTPSPVRPMTNACTGSHLGRPPVGGHPGETAHACTYSPAVLCQGMPPVDPELLDLLERVNSAVTV